MCDKPVIMRLFYNVFDNVNKYEKAKTRAKHLEIHRSLGEMRDYLAKFEHPMHVVFAGIHANGMVQKAYDVYIERLQKIIPNDTILRFWEFFYVFSNVPVHQSLVYEYSLKWKQLENVTECDLFLDEFAKGMDEKVFKQLLFAVMQIGEVDSLSWKPRLLLRGWLTRNLAEKRLFGTHRHEPFVSRQKPVLSCVPEAMKPV